MRSLPPPEFVKIDPAAIEADLLARYEQKSGKTLYPAQIERLFIDQLAYAQALALTAIQNAGEQLLVRFSNGPILDYLGELVSTPRLLAKSARCLLQFKIEAASPTSVIIPVSTQAATQDGRIVFATEADAVIQPGQTQVQVYATCMTVGTEGNGWAIGQITQLLDAPVDGLSVSNISVSADGAEDEKDDRYRERIILAPESYTTGGSRGAYRYHALSVHQSIIDVAIYGPDEGQPGGHVAVYPLTETGLPSESLLQQVNTYLSGEKLRPLCDTVNAVQPERVAFTIQAELIFYSSTDRTQALELAWQAAEEWVDELRSELGRDIVPEQLIAVLQVKGVYRVVLTGLNLQELAKHQWADCTNIDLTDGGLVDG